jgi:aspartate carbamoyltransferase catalytic subunit
MIQSSSNPLHHLITLEGLSKIQLFDILDLAESLHKNPENLSKYQSKIAAHHVMVSLFFEPSTRTRLSFELAAKRCGINTLIFDSDTASTQKGECLLDTFQTLEAMGCTLFVVRHAEAGIVATLANHAQSQTVLINAGDGDRAHPTQGLLDAYTIRQHKGSDFTQRSVLIVGDIIHSRVAQSNLHALRTLGVPDIRFCGPSSLLPKSNIEGVRLFDSLDEALKDVDVIMTLRVQKERFVDQTAIPNEQTYAKHFGLTAQRLKHAEPNALVMHPGPINRGVEIESEVADGAQSVILQQVNNGVYVRMAVMLKLLCS